MTVLAMSITACIVMAVLAYAIIPKPTTDEREAYDEEFIADLLKRRSQDNGR